MTRAAWWRSYALWLGGSLAAVALSATMICVLANAESRSGRFTILQLNDVYRIEGILKGKHGGLARLRTLRQQLEKDAPVLVLHAGDALSPAVLSKYLHARPMVRSLNLLDGDASAFDPHLVATFGNHEFDDLWPDLVTSRVLESDFQWVSSNVRFQWSRTGPDEPLSRRLDNVHETLVVPIGGVRVGILGLTLEDKTPDWLHTQYRDEAQRNAAVRKALDRLAGDGAQVVVALTHQELGQDRALARSFPEINLIVGGHEHSYLQEKVGKTWITKADADAVSTVRIEVRVNADGEVLAYPERVEIDERIAPDPRLTADVDAAFRELDAVFAKEGKKPHEHVYAKAEHLLEGVEPAVRGRETALGNFLTDEIRKKTKAPIAILNGGSIRINDSIPRGGDLTQYDMEGIFFFDDELVSFELTGAELLTLLRKSVSEAHLAHGRFLQVSGLEFDYHVDRSSGEPRYEVKEEEVKVATLAGGAANEPLQLEARYAVASTCFLWTRGVGDGYAIFASGKGGTSPKRLDGSECKSKPEDKRAWAFRTAVEETLGSLPGNVIRTGIEGRIERIDG